MRGVARNLSGVIVAGMPSLWGYFLSFMRRMKMTPPLPSGERGVHRPRLHLYLLTPCLHELSQLSLVPGLLALLLPGLLFIVTVFRLFVLVSRRRWGQGQELAVFPKLRVERRSGRLAVTRLGIS